MLCSGLGSITPNIEENNDLKSIWRYKILAEIWEIIQNTLVWKKNYISSIRILVDNKGL